MGYYLSVDIGASSGRLILSHIEAGKIKLKEIHRFENGMIRENGHLLWDTDRLFKEILIGMKKCSASSKIPKSIGVDTWAVDYVLLDQEGKRLAPVYGYRDSRTEGIDQKVYEIIDEKSLYARTGIQKQPFNTIYQLMAAKTFDLASKKNPESKAETHGLLNQAHAMLMIPDYLHYLLCGVMATEYTNASTTQLLNPVTKDWDWDLIRNLGFNEHIFCNICLPGQKLGRLTEDVAKEVGFTCDVVVPATHDTGAAVMAVPGTEENILYISSGTWSLMGTELKEAICTEKSRQCNFTNEGGYDYRFRFLKNIMGMWMINSVRKELAPSLSFDEICDGAAKESIASLVDADADRFLAPDNMTAEVQKACQESGQQVPEGIFEVAAVIYQSLASCYAKTVDEIESITGKQFDAIHIIGGGANAGYLNELTARTCKRRVLSGPIEATALGNALSQMLAAGDFASLQEARACIRQSFDIKVYE